MKPSTHLTKPPITHKTKEDKGEKHQHKKARTKAHPQNTDPTEDKTMNTKPPKEQPLGAKENDTKTQQEQERKQRWERAKQMHLKKYRKVLGYRKTENDVKRTEVTRRKTWNTNKGKHDKRTVGKKNAG
jgi:hypothetical protein